MNHRILVESQLGRLRTALIPRKLKVRKLMAVQRMARRLRAKNLVSRKLLPATMNNVMEGIYFSFLKDTDAGQHHG